MECALRSGIEVYLRSGFGVALECDTGVALECVANMQIDTPVPLRSGNGVVSMEWQWSVHFITTPANFGSGIGVVIRGDKESINVKTKPRK